MTSYIATFHTHFSAMRTHRTMAAEGVSARLSPVPRSLSASCGTCVMYEASEARLDLMDKDVERVVECLTPNGGYLELLRND
ncbi:MAG: DUF3343 domain-containing protein [Clostridiales bacterium]|nr:DUF3343 domain-containing protein [Clostridiales bacterium]